MQNLGHDFILIGTVILIITFITLVMNNTKTEKRKKSKVIENIHSYITKILMGLMEVPRTEENDFKKTVINGEIVGIKHSSVTITVTSEPGISIVRIEGEFQNEFRMSFQQISCRILSALKEKGVQGETQWLIGGEEEEREIMITIIR